MDGSLVGGNGSKFGSGDDMGDGFTNSGDGGDGALSE